MDLHRINRRLVDLRLSELDESELDELNKKKADLAKKKAKAEKDGEDKLVQDLEPYIQEVDQEIEKIKKLYDSERREGRFRFKSKKYISYHSTERPPYHFTWCRYSASNNYRDLSEWQARWGYTPVKYGVDPFWPESVYVNASNYYQLGDLVWVKCNLRDYLIRKIEEQQMSQAGGRAKLDEVEQELAAHNAALNRYPDETLQRELQARKAKKLTGQARLDEMAEQVDKLGVEVPLETLKDLSA